MAAVINQADAAYLRAQGFVISKSRTYATARSKDKVISLRRKGRQSGRTWDWVCLGGEGHGFPDPVAAFVHAELAEWRS
jgi:hypothetical protein